MHSFPAAPPLCPVHQSPRLSFRPTRAGHTVVPVWPPLMLRTNGWAVCGGALPWATPSAFLSPAPEALAPQR